MVKLVTFKKLICGILMGAFIAITAGIGTQAVNFNYTGRVIADGVRLRVYPDYGTILGLMYTDEVVAISKEESSPSAYYVKRDQAHGGGIGYADAHFIETDMEW